ncbi:GDSL esterase/lipase 1 [Ricinus communis]|uniref:Zinc finger protein, putative n=1 Tax=Ricinus communis TaxID=3988 RepID=B9T4S6_RICCO|nr:GDSL esterase/lipase 1 [Ricinus communis]EEF29146.1 zinc finger protein, putative [Ricinus communis]|eukprot:XP_002533245.1 GDSL esterase/lipase 1 [Ricinus communis]
MASLNFHVCFLVFFASLLIPTSSQSRLWSAKNHAALFIFGDSLFDAGNNNYLQNAAFRAYFWPYGETFFKFPTGRFSDGRLIPDFIAENIKLPFIPPYLQPGNHYYTFGVNFASAGAGALVETRQGMVIDLKTQLEYFKDVEQQIRQKLGDAEANTLISEAIYLFSIGGNDYIELFISNSSVFQSYSREEYVGIVMGNLTTVIKEIYKSGGRRFGFVNIGPYGCAPFSRTLNASGGCLDEATILIELHNIALSNVLKDLQEELKGFQYSILDFFTTLSERMNNPLKYGFKEGKVACCGSGPFRGILNCGGMGGLQEYELCDNPNDYVFFDGGHLTEKAYNQLANLMWSGSPNATQPYNLKTILQA